MNCLIYTGWLKCFKLVWIVYLSWATYHIINVCFVNVSTIQYNTTVGNNPWTFHPPSYNSLHSYTICDRIQNSIGTIQKQKQQHLQKQLAVAVAHHSVGDPYFLRFIIITHESNKRDTKKTPPPAAFPNRCNRHWTQRTSIRCALLAYEGYACAAQHIRPHCRWHIACVNSATVSSKARVAHPMRSVCDVCCVGRVKRFTIYDCYTWCARAPIALIDFGGDVRPFSQASAPDDGWIWWARDISAAEMLSVWECAHSVLSHKKDSMRDNLWILLSE